MPRLLSIILFFLGISMSVVGQNQWEFKSLKRSSQNQNFYLPTGYAFQRIMVQGDQYDNGDTIPENHDFTGYVPINNSSEHGYLFVNHENVPGGMTRMEIKLDTSSRTWFTISTDPVDFSAVNGTGKNCSGAITPWGTVVTAEEIYTIADTDSNGYMDLGWLVEIDTSTGHPRVYPGETQPEKLYAMGRFQHENAVFSEDSITAYYGADHSTRGFVYKFVSDVKTDFRSGDLFALSAPTVSSETAQWVQIPNVTKNERNRSRDLADSLGAISFNGVEDCEIGPDGRVYFSSKATGRIYAFEDIGNSVNLEIYIEKDTMTLDTETGPEIELWNTGADNLAFDGDGNLWVLQDGGKNYVWRVSPGYDKNDPQAGIFARTPKGCEPTGITFTPDFKYLFMSIQHPYEFNSVVNIDAASNDVVFDRATTLVIGLQGDLGIATGIKSVNEISTRLKAYPNPANDKLMLACEERNTSVTVDLYPVNGSSIMSSTDMTSSTGEIQLDISAVPTGLYIVVIKTDKRLYTTGVQID